MSSASAAARPSPRSAPLRLPRLADLLLAPVALVATAVIAVAQQTTMGVVATVLALSLAVATGVAVQRARPVSGPRAVPRWYAPTAVLITLAVLITREVTSGWPPGLRTADAVLLAAAPGPLLVAADAPLWRALRRGRPHGVTLRSTAALASDVTTLALDGVHTLVEGKVVSDVTPVEESHLRNLRWFAGALAHASPAPWGPAVATLAGRGNLTEVTTEESGITGYVDRHPVRIGDPTWLGMATAEGPWEALGVEVDGRSLGFITVADRLRPGVADDVATLSAAGVRVLLVSAEGARAAAVTELAGVDEGAPSLLTDAEVAVLSERRIGAGLHLGPGSDQVELEHADLASGTLALRLCRDADRAVRRGVTVALGWHALCVVLAAAGLLPPPAAAAAALVGVGVAYAYGLAA